MPEVHIKNPIIGTYTACGPFTKNKQRINKFLETGDLRYIYTEMNWIKLVFNMIWLMILKI